VRKAAYSKAGLPGAPDGDDISPSRRKNMRAVRAKNTHPELTVRRALHRMGYRYRLHAPELPGRPDIVFRPRMKAIEIRGCFWHQHDASDCPNAVMPKTRNAWWSAKLARNIERDEQNLTRLHQLGWQVLVLWECELSNDDLGPRLRSFLDVPGEFGATHV
jgi:DNA mismatch endonuclease Vsr